MPSLNFSARQKDACYVVASWERNSAICDNAAMESKKDGCYRTVAIQSGNPALCSKI